MSALANIMIPIGFWFYIFGHSYALVDVVIIIFTNKQQRDAVKKLLTKAVSALDLQCAFTAV